MQMPAVFYYAEEFFSGFAQVNVDGQVEPGREFKLKPEDLLLLLRGLRPVVEVETYLPDCHRLAPEVRYERVQFVPPVGAD